MTSLSAPVISVVCLSGGMDSTALLLRLLARGDSVRGLSFDYGQRHRVELDRLRDNLDYLRQRGCGPASWDLIELRGLGPLLHSSLTDDRQAVPLGHYEEESMRSTFVPNRNALFGALAYGVALSAAARHPRADVRIALGVHAGDHALYPDCRPEFYQQLFAAFRLGNWGGERVALELPYQAWNKAKILRDAVRDIEKLGLDFQTVFRHTCTSYAPDAAGRSHGLTGSDVERILAFDELGLVDPLEYARPWPELVQQARALEAEFRARRRGP